MAKNEDADEQDGAKPPAKSKKKLIVMAVAGLLVVGGGGFGAYKFLFAKKPAETPVAEIAKPAVFVDLPDMVVNLATVEGGKIARLKIALEVADLKAAELIRPQVPRILDSFQVYMRELRPMDLDGSAGMFRLKDELMRRINIAIAPSKVSAILFKEIVVQ